MESSNSKPERESDPACFQCQTCAQTFAKAQHLKRHASTHVDDKPFPCGFCDSQFKRSDALRRHWKTCTLRLQSGYPIVQRSLSGKRIQACDHCAKRKRACNQERPCTECAVHEFECTYTRKRKNLEGHVPAETDSDVLHTDFTGCSPAIDSHQAEEDTTIEASQLRNEIGISTERQLNFLLKFTHATGINQGYNCNRSFMADTTSESDLTSADNTLRSTPGVSNPWSYLLEEIPLWPDGGKGPLSRLNSPLTGGRTSSNLERQCAEIWELFSSSSHHSMEGSTIMTSIMGFFSPEHVIHSLDVFWDRWYSHCPILLKTTFEVEDCSPLLLASMVLMGGCTSSSEADQRIAKSLLDIAENIVFSHPIYATTTSIPVTTDRGDNASVMGNIRILQATYFICIMQKWEGSEESKIRIQRDQFTKFVSAARAMGLSTGTHGNTVIDPDFDDHKWREWVRKEEMIRTFNYVFLLDSAFVIFHNSVPRMVLQEMQIDLTCPEDLFQASSPAEFVFALYSNPGTPPGPISLVDTIRRLCAEPPVETDTPDNTDFLKCASKLNFFTIATAIHGLIFHQKSSLYTLPSYQNPLRRALDRWDALWELHSQKVSNPESPQSAISSYKEIGFMQHADEFAVLARISLQLSYMSSAELTEFLGRLSKGLAIGRGQGGKYATFDQAGMGQVGELVLAMESVNLNI